MSHANLIRLGIFATLLAVLGLRSASVRSDAVFTHGAPGSIAQVPLYLRDAVAPLNMLVMGKDHKIYYEAYNDASDLNGDGSIDVGYRGWELKAPAPTDGSSRYKIDYYGYFNSYVCYGWDGNKFVPQAAAPNKTCSGRWSGDFLNYLTTSRMDALRRVLFGGWRQVDTVSSTVLQGAYFPQDAHSWGKEYDVQRDGYDIANYAPLSTPTSGRYHLFAVTTLTGNTNTFAGGYQAPVLRVLKDSPYRVWNWLSIEGPVAGLRCFNASNTRVTCTSGGTAQPHPGHPGSRSAFDTLVANYATPANRFGTGSLTTINCANSDCNPFGADDNYLAMIEGQIAIPAGHYQFRIDGDDVVDFQLRRGNGTVLVEAGCYTTAGRGFGTCSNAEKTPVFNFGAGVYNFTFRQEEATGGDGYRLEFRSCTGAGEGSCGNWANVFADGGSGGLRTTTLTTYNLRPASGGTTRDDYLVRVESCPANASLREATCKAYDNGGNTVWKPTGILHDYGENQKMYFGLITGSQRNNLQGGKLRRNVSNFADEIEPDTGIFRSNVNGIVNTISRLRMIGGGYQSGVLDNTTGDTNWNWANGTGNCESQGGRALNNGECRMWGNPLAEMLYESLRYFAGAAALPGGGATPAYSTTGGSSIGDTEEATMGLDTETWRDPYAEDGGFPQCAKPYQTIISDINPSYDSDLPGNRFGSTLLPDGATPSAISAFDAGAEGDAIWAAEGYAGSRNVFVGDVGGTTDGAPTAKSASSFGSIRGLSPEEPSKQGSYYSASVARFARNRDVNARTDNQFVSTYSVALASPLPRIEFPVGSGKVTLIPFAKTASGTFGGGTRKPTNTIVDFYVEQLFNLPGGQSSSLVNGGRPSAIFRINYEDVEQGNDHDMDAIVRYEVNANADGTVTVTLNSEYAAGSANQNMGYVISGTNNDGVYLEVRDTDSPATSYPYALNTPPGRSPGFCNGNLTTECGLLPFTATRTFTLSSGSSAIQLKDPLWYAAKYGAPVLGELRPNGDPVNYFLVTNPLDLKTQLSKAFDDIANRNLDVGAAAVSGARVGNSSFTLQPVFRRGRNGKDWTGNLSAVAVNRDGSLGSRLWDAQAELPAPGLRNVRVITTPGIRTVREAGEFRDTNASLTLVKLGITAGTITSVYGSSYTVSDFVGYLRGDQSREASQGGANTLRTRTAVLGDIVNSEPVIASPRSNFGYGYYSDAMFSGYAGTGGYLTTKLSRKTVAYVGANDGMLHAFDATTRPCTDDTKTCAEDGAGDEMFAVVPNGVLNAMGELPKPDSNFNHRYFVDGQITVADAKDGSTWKTILAASLGGGGRAVFALDASNPTAFVNDDVLWERNSAVDNDIGAVYGKPLLVPLENGKWGVLFGNGYGGARSDPSLYILDAFTGAPIQKLVGNDGNLAITGGADCGLVGMAQLNICAGRPAAPYNGLGQITAIDRNGNGKIDTVYGGDLQGNLWKFDLSNASQSSWKVANDGKALFRTQSSTNESAQTQYQPITGGIRVAAGPGTGVMVYFGTGRYLMSGDNTVSATPQVQSFYGFFDNFNETLPTATRTVANMQQQTVTLETTAGGFTTRNISTTPVYYFGTSATRGWYLDLKLDSSANGVGERFIATPLIQSGRVFFTTFTPQRNSCDPGGLNFQYALDLLSGNGTLANVKVLGTGQVACTDGSCGAAALTGQGGETSMAPVMGTGLAAINPVQKIVPTCDPATESCATFEECQVVIYPGQFVLPRPCGRQSWRQLK